MKVEQIVDLVVRRYEEWEGHSTAWFSHFPVGFNSNKLFLPVQEKDKPYFLEYGWPAIILGAVVPNLTPINAIGVLQQCDDEYPYGLGGKKHSPSTYDRVLRGIKKKLAYILERRGLVEWENNR